MSSTSFPSVLGQNAGPWDAVAHWLVLAPHPDDFDVVAVTLRHFSLHGAGITLEVLSGGASGVEDAFASGWEEKTRCREREQRESCARFGLDPGRLRFHRLIEDESGHMADVPENQQRVWRLLETSAADGVILPHGNDSNADHRRTFRWFSAWRATRFSAPLALLTRDPKTIGMRVDLICPYDESAAAWKAELLRCHRSQHERNLRSRGIGFDERILASDRDAAKPFGHLAAESYEILHADPSGV